MLTKDKGVSWELPSIDLKEKIYNYKADHTIKAASSKGKRADSAQDVSGIRHGLLGNSLDVTSMAVLLLPLLQEWGYIGPEVTAKGFAA